MKVEFKTSKGEFAFVKTPAKWSSIDYCFGLVKNLTEEQWAEVVDSSWIGNKSNIVYRDYVGVDTWNCNTAIESGKSLMDSLEVYLENPIEEPFSMNYTPEYGIQKYPQESYHADLHEYEKAQERTGSWLLIIYL